ncbi:MAG: hypothetical protein P1S60_00710, partial [Anaerolineae bacterium]|nr:hypothetical protein [Anaerolineae bacterium]
MTKTKQELDVWAVGWSIRVLVLITFLAAFAVPLGLVPIIAVATSEGQTPVQVAGPITVLLSTPQPTPTITVFTPTPAVPAPAPTPASESTSVSSDALTATPGFTAVDTLCAVTTVRWDASL